MAPANRITNEVIIHTPIHFAYEPASDAEFAAVWKKGREKFPWLAAEERDLSGLYKRHGKLILYAGWSDPVAPRRSPPAHPDN